MKFDSDKSPLILSFSPQARLGELASQRGRIRKRMRLGEGTPEFSPALQAPSPMGRGLG